MTPVAVACFMFFVHDSCLSKMSKIVIMPYIGLGYMKMTWWAPTGQPIENDGTSPERSTSKSKLHETSNPKHPCALLKKYHQTSQPNWGTISMARAAPFNCCRPLQNSDTVIIPSPQLAMSFSAQNVVETCWQMRTCPTCSQTCAW